MSFRPWLAGLLVLQLSAGPALASPDGSREAAEQHQRNGKSAFKAGRVEEALASFLAAYRATPRPEYLLNIAQCQRALGRREQAIDFLTRFIEVAPRHSLRPAAEQTLSELRAEQTKVEAASAEEQARKASALVPEDAPRVRDSLKPPLDAEPSRVVETVPAARPAASHTGLWIALGAAVLAAAGVGLYVATRPAEPRVIGHIELPP